MKTLASILFFWAMLSMGCAHTPEQQPNGNAPATQPANLLGAQPANRYTLLNKEAPPPDREKVDSTPLCKSITKLKVGMTKKAVGKFLGDPTYSSMQTCGGAKGVARWACEQISYECRYDSESTNKSVINIWYNGEQVNHWQ